MHVWCAPTWRFHTELCKFLRNISTNTLYLRFGRTYRPKTWRSVLIYFQQDHNFLTLSAEWFSISLTMDGQISPREWVDLLFAREICCTIVSNISLMHGGWWCRVLLLLLEMRDLDKLRSKLEIIMEKRMLDTCQHISVVCNHCKNLLQEMYKSESLFNITALLVRLAQTITKLYMNKIPWLLLYFTCITTICSTLTIDCTKLGDFCQ